MKVWLRKFILCLGILGLGSSEARAGRDVEFSRISESCGREWVALGNSLGIKERRGLARLFHGTKDTLETLAEFRKALVFDEVADEDGVFLLNQLSGLCLAEVYKAKKTTLCKISLPKEASHLEKVVEVLCKESYFDPMFRFAEYRLSESDYVHSLLDAFRREVRRNSKIEDAPCGNRCEFFYWKAKETFASRIKDIWIMGIYPEKGASLIRTSGQKTYWHHHYVLVLQMIGSNQTFVLDSFTPPYIFVGDSVSWVSSEFLNVKNVTNLIPKDEVFRWAIPWDPARDGGSHR